MNTLMAMQRGVSAELYKFRRTFLLWFLIIAPAFIPFINLMIFLKRGEQIIPPGENAWDYLLQFSIAPANSLFPFFVMIVALYVSSIEHTSNTWKLIYTQPLSRAVVYTSKVIAFLLMLLFSLMLSGAFIVGVGYLLYFIKPELGFTQAYDLSLFFKIAFKLFLCTLGYAAIQFWLSQHLKNLLLPLGVGIAGFISFMILSQGWEYAEYHPYGYPIMGLGKYTAPDYQWWSKTEFIYRSVGLAAVVFILAGVDMVRKRIV